MAACKDSALFLADLYKDSFYFKERECTSQTIPVTDDFKGTRMVKPCWIKSNEEKFLVLKTPGTFEFVEMTTNELEQTDCNFNIQIYRDSEVDKSQPVMLYICVDGQKMMVSCKNETEVFPEPMGPDAPQVIKQTRHKALFRWKLISSIKSKSTMYDIRKYNFESTMYDGHFLALESVDDLHKLILRPKDEVDESTVFNVDFSKSSP